MKHWDQDLDWYLNQRAAALGLRSSMGGQLNALETGGGGVFAQPEWKFDERDVARARRLERRWRALTPPTRALLIHHYSGRSIDSLPPGLRGALSDPPWIAIYVAEQTGKREELIGACQSQGEGAAEFLRALEATAQRLQVEIHQAWRETMTGGGYLSDQIRRVFA